MLRYKENCGLLYTVTDLLKALSYGTRKTRCWVNMFKQTHGQQYRSGVFYVICAETVARQQPERSGLAG
jgi:hypothetical protein